MQRRSTRGDWRFNDTAVAALTREQLAVRAQSLRDRGRIVEALELVRDWQAWQTARKVRCA